MTFTVQEVAEAVAWLRKLPLVIEKSPAASVVQSRFSPRFVAFTVNESAVPVVGEADCPPNVIVGAVVSTMTDLDVAVPVLPARSVWVATRAYVPSAGMGVVRVSVHVPLEQVALTGSVAPALTVTVIGVWSPVRTPQVPPMEEIPALV